MGGTPPPLLPSALRAQVYGAWRLGNYSSWTEGVLDHRPAAAEITQLMSEGLTSC